MVYQMGQDVKKEWEQHLGHVGATTAQQQHDTEDHFKAEETEILLMKAASRTCRAPRFFEPHQATPTSI